MKHIICIIDGTWLNAAADTPNFGYSNAYNLNWMLESEDGAHNPQIVIYLSGLGSDRSSQPYTAGAFARGIDHQIREAYINIASNYREQIISETEKISDKIYLFGFSRGAVAARAVSGLISKIGLLRPDRIRQYDSMWLDYLGKIEEDDHKKEIRQKLLETVSRPVEIEFLGAFDAVLGNRNNETPYRELNFKDLNLSSKVKAATHILALDEARKLYRPLYWRGLANGGTQVLEQIWMPGVHSDIGGIYERDTLGKIALRSMIDRIMKHTSLSFNNSAMGTLFAKPGPLVVHNERVGHWKFTSRNRPRKYDARVPCQWLHPVCSKIGPLIASYKGKKNRGEIYSIPDAFGAGLREFAGFDPGIAWEKMLQ